MTRNLFLAIAPLFLLSTILPAQQKTIKIWPEKIPGAIYNEKIKEHSVFINGGAERIYNVTDPTLSVFLPVKTKPNGTAVIICPGGGYGRLAMPHEGTGVAERLNETGITAFVLKYRLPNDSIMTNKMIGPLQDIQEAIRIVRRNSAEWKIDPAKIGVMGFSAGGHLAATASTHYSYKTYNADTACARPDFAVLIYPVITMNKEFTHLGSRKNLLGDNPKQEFVDEFSNELHVTKDTPPTFMALAGDDASVPPLNSTSYFFALRKNNVPAEIHIYEKGGHGFGLGKSGSTESNWFSAFIDWMKARKICE